MSFVGWDKLFIKVGKTIYEDSGKRAGLEIIDKILNYV